MKNSFDQYILEKISNDSSLRKNLENAEQAISIAQKLYDLRKNRGLTQAELAKLINVSQPNIARLESGDYKSYSLRTLNKAVVALKSDIKIIITPLEETQTVNQVWNIASWIFPFGSKIEKTETTNINLSTKTKDEAISFGFYNYAI
jgi:transcriptional regulator with XRE-family HTH domain